MTLSLCVQFVTTPTYFAAFEVTWIRASWDKFRIAVTAVPL